MIAEYCSIFFATLGLFTSMLEHEIYMMSDKLAAPPITIMILETINFFCTVFLLCSLYIRYDIWLEWSVSVNSYTNYDTLRNTGLWKNLMIELIICAISPYPFLNEINIQEYVKAYDELITIEINDILLFAMFSRIYLLVRYSFYLTKFLNPRTQRVCNIYGCESDSMFALKAVVLQMPIQFLIYALTLSLFIFGYQLRMFEAPLSEVSGQDFNSLSNSIWNVIITLTSVGYGDIFPKTFFGRIVGCFICFWGVLIVSFFVITISDKLEFTPNE